MFLQSDWMNDPSLLRADYLTDRNYQEINYGFNNSAPMTDLLVLPKGSICPKEKGYMNFIDQKWFG